MFNALSAILSCIEYIMENASMLYTIHALSAAIVGLVLRISLYYEDLFHSTGIADHTYFSALTELSPVQYLLLLKAIDFDCSC